MVGNLTTGTVLAPTNDAFDAALTVLENLGVTVSALTDIPTDALREVSQPARQGGGMKFSWGLQKYVGAVQFRALDC